MITGPDTPAATSTSWAKLVGLGFGTPVMCVALFGALTLVVDSNAIESAKLSAIALVAWLAWLLPLAVLGVLVLRRHWASRPVLAGYLALVGTVSWLPLRVMVVAQRESAVKAVLSPLRQVAACKDQFFLEAGAFRIFVSRDELIGPERYLRALDSRSGQDYGSLFPIRRDAGDTLPVTRPDGRTVQRTEVLTVTMADGRQVFYSRLDDPEGRRIDGVHTIRFPDGRRFELTYHGGVPDGPFRAYHADGRLWGEATYVRGRVVGPSWLYTPDGRKIDELTERERANAAMQQSAESATREAKSIGLQKLQAGDHAGAIEEFTRALRSNPGDLSLHRHRGDARKARGDLDGAINDYLAAEGIPSVGDDLPVHLKNAFIERGRLLQAKHDLAGAKANFRAVAHPAARQAEKLLKERSFAQAIRVLSAAIELVPVAELLDHRADARRALRDLEGAAADYTHAIELADQGELFFSANRRAAVLGAQYKRAHVRRGLGDLGGAAEDFRATISDVAVGTVYRPALWLYFVQCEQGRQAQAGAELAQTDRSRWNRTESLLGRFLLGEITEAELAAAVATSPWPDSPFCTAFYTAVRRRLAGDRAGALACFREASKHSTYDDFAMEETRRMVAELERKTP